MPYTDPTKQRQSIVTSQRRRVKLLDQLAQAAGWRHWSQFATAVKRGAVEIPQKAQGAPAMYKSINLYKNTDQHDFESLDAALKYFRANWKKAEVISKSTAVNGLTQGEKTTVKDQIMIGLWKDDADNDPLYTDAPDEVIMLQNQTPRDYPL